jgi:hypothetical protein
VTVDLVMNRRTLQLQVSTRSEIVMSIVSVLFFVAVLLWRLASVGFALQPIGLAAAAAIAAFSFRQIILRPGPPLDTSSSGLAYYRHKLELRRHHLRNAWLWHGPLLVAVLLLIANFTGRAFPDMDRFRNAAPLFLVLVLWTVIGIRRRFRQAVDIQHEIDEIVRMEQHE